MFGIGSHFVSQDRMTPLELFYPRTEGFLFYYELSLIFLFYIFSCNFSFLFFILLEFFHHIIFFQLTCFKN